MSKLSPMQRVLGRLERLEQALTELLFASEGEMAARYPERLEQARINALTALWEDVD